MVCFGFWKGLAFMGSQEERALFTSGTPAAPDSLLCGFHFTDLCAFIGKHRDFQELVAGQAHLCCLVGTGGEGNGTPLQYSCLENPMDGGAW